jgi:hypothetical protein
MSRRHYIPNWQKSDILEPDSLDREIVAGRANRLDARTGVANSWSRCSALETAKAIHRMWDRNPDSMRMDDVLLWRQEPHLAPIVNSYMTQSDFPGVATQAILVTATQLYDLAPPSLRRIAARRDRQTFQPGFATRIAAPVLQELLHEWSGQDDGQIKTSTLYERKETAQLKTFATIINISRMMLIADQLNQIGDVVRNAIAAAVQKEEDLLFSVIAPGWDTVPVANPDYAGVTMADGNKLFSTAHANTGTGVIASAGLAAGFEALLDQKDANNVHFLNTAPAYLLCGPKNVVTAKTQLQLLAFDNQIQVLPEPRLFDTTNWYLAADPALCPGLEYGSLAGSPRPRVQLDQAWTVDGMRFRLIHDTNAWAVDWRPLYRSTGA